MISDLTTNLLQFTRHEIGSTTKSLYSLKDMNEKNMNATNTTELQIILSPTFLVVLIVFKCSCFVCGVLGNLSVIISLAPLTMMRHNEYKNCYRQLAGVVCNRLG